MQLILPDILAEARGFTVAFSVAGLSVGLLLWLFGWWGHRFWIVLTATLGAGIWGLYSGKFYGVQPLAAGPAVRSPATAAGRRARRAS